MQEMDYHEQKHAERSARINADILHEAARKAGAAEATDASPEAADIPQEELPAQSPGVWSPRMAMELDLQKQREREDQLTAVKQLEAEQQTRRAEQQRRQHEALVARRAAWENEETTPEREQWHAELTVEIERQQALLSAAHPNDWDPGYIREQAQARAYTVLKQRRAEAQPESLEAQVARLTRKVAAIDEFLRGATKRYLSAV